MLSVSSVEDVIIFHGVNAIIFGDLDVIILIVEDVIIFHGVNVIIFEGLDVIIFECYHFYVIIFPCTYFVLSFVLSFFVIIYCYHFPPFSFS
jgi:hypothetical protein